MKSDVVVGPVEVLADERGLVFEPIQPHVVGRQNNVHLVLTQPGCVRGNHYHVRGTETVIVFGHALIRFRVNGADRDIEVPDGKVFRFIFPPGVPHAFKNIGKDTILLVCFNTERYSHTQPDSVPAQLIC